MASRGRQEYEGQEEELQEVSDHKAAEAIHEGREQEKRSEAPQSSREFTACTRTIAEVMTPTNAIRERACKQTLWAGLNQFASICGAGGYEQTL